MIPENGYYDIGGPMVLGEEYRWNVPVVTYGFDQSFLDYFGQPGVDAVEQAIQIINDLPPASDMVLTNYALDTRRYNFIAQEAQLYDLKSTALPLLLGQLGLTSPKRYIWALRRWDPIIAGQWIHPGWFLDGLGEIDLESQGFIPYFCEKRNYDPFSLEASSYVNETLYSFLLIISRPNHERSFINPFPVDPLASDESAVCDAYPYPGFAYTGLTQDDVGGLLYLLNRTNINVEALDEMTSPAPGNTNNLVRTAPRPGVEKIAFVRQTNNASSGFLAMTNQFADIYFTNGIQATQLVQRVTTRPDFIFSAKDLGFMLIKDQQGNPFFFLANSQRTGVTNWINNCDLNTNSAGAGPGVIHGPVEITFQTPGKYLAAAGSVTNSAVYLWNWAGFSNDTNIVALPGNQTNVTSMTLSIQTVLTNGLPLLEWMVLGHQDANYRIEISTNLLDWSSADVVTNTNGIFIFQHPADHPAQYFRTILE
ncbi:MAG: hypothetical protein JWQ71_2672 [Pedosphaera sp.]|nr:hypothetical protein [Pedosphaera sp.]